MGKGMVLTVCQYHKQRKDLSETQSVKSYYMTKIVYSGVSWYSHTHTKSLIFLGQQNSERKGNLSWSRIKMYTNSMADLWFWKTKCAFY